MTPYGIAPGFYFLTSQEGAMPSNSAHIKLHMMVTLHTISGCPNIQTDLTLVGQNHAAAGASKI